MRPFRFGVTMFLLGEAQEWADKCRLAETLGYDTIHVPDRLGLPALVRIADATVRPRVAPAGPDRPRPAVRTYSS